MSSLKTRKFLLLVAGLVLIIAVSAQSGWTAAPQRSVLAGPATPGPQGQAAPAKAPYPGTYIFLDNTNVDPASAAFVGGHLKFFWSDIEVARDFYDWSPIDNWLQEQSSLGKPAVIGISLYDGRCCGGQHTPRWLQWQDPTTIIRCDTTTVNWPIPNYSHSTLLAEHRQFIKDLAVRYDGDPRVAWIEMGTGIFGEAKPADVSDWKCLLDAGLTTSVWIDTSKEIMNHYAEAFQKTPVVYQFAPIYNPQGGSMAQRRTLTDYAASLGIGIKHNGLEPDTTTAIVNDASKPYYKAGQWDPFFTHWQDVPTGWETYASAKCLDPLATPPAPNAGITMWCVYAGLNAHADYFVFDRALVTDLDRQSHLEFARHYLGAEIGTTDSVWVALREHQPMAGDFFPPRGNFGMWLYQNDAVPGGRTAPAWNKGSSMEGRYTRRTDRAKGNASIYFDVDNDWLYRNTDRTVTVEVIYLDEGADTWSLHYDAVDAADKVAGTVRKTNTGRWLTETFALTDAFLGDRLPGGGGRQGSDFYLSSNDADDFFHRIRVFKSGVPPTPTPLPIVTATPTSTPDPATSTAPLTLRLRNGVDGYDGATDTFLANACGTGSADISRIPQGGSERLSLRASGPAGAAPTVGLCNALIRFDISTIPPGSHILSARLVVKGYKQSNAARLYFNTFDVLKPWSEDQATWYQTQTGLPWAKPGADGPHDHTSPQFDTSVLSGPAEPYGWAGAYITPLVQRWVDDAGSNNGVLLVPFGSFVQWDLASTEHPEVRWRPALELVYYLPGGPPATATSTPTATPSITPSATQLPSATPTGTDTPTLTPTPSAVPSATPTSPATLSPTSTPTATPTTMSGVWLWLPRYLR